MNNESHTPDNDFSKLSESFKGLLGSPEMMFQFLDILSQPIQVFDPDGTLIFSNKVFLDFNGIEYPSAAIGKYNLLRDPVCDALFGHETLVRGFRGETIICRNIPAPIDDLVNRGFVKEKPFETAYLDASLLPIFNGDKLAYVINTFAINRIYQGLPEVARAKEYIDSHWLDKFDAHAVAKAVNVSYSTMAPIFRQQTGMTLQDYYQQVKIDHIKEKLGDKSLTIQQVFNACGADSRDGAPNCSVK